jgi:hypothetical protein
MAYAAAGARLRIEREVIDAAMARITAVARVMDALFVIPGTGIRVGFDAILGLVPVAGDLLAQVIATYIIWEAHQLGVGKFTLMRISVTRSSIRSSARSRSRATPSTWPSAPT